MILWLGIGAGLTIGLGLSKIKGLQYIPPNLNYIWIVFLGILPQFFAIYFWKTRVLTPDWLAALCLVVSQFILFIFAWLNRKHLGMKVLIVGLLLNLIVIALNGGFMPISSQTVERLVGENVISQLSPGSRFGYKDILLPAQETKLEFLSDHFLPPVNFPYQVAYSLGDIFIALGVFGILAYQKNSM